MKHKKNVKSETNLLLQHLHCIQDEIEDNVNVVNLGPKYIKSTVNEFKNSHAAFVYGKRQTEGHYVNRKGESVYLRTMRIGKLNPKYTEMIQEIMDGEEKKQNLEMFD
jgi:hypothetical protein